MDRKWSEWAPFPNPRDRGVLAAPLGAGCYEIRHRGSGELVLFGMAGHVAARMTSLLPPPYGTGTRRNDKKRKYILRNLADLEYRTLACATRTEAVQCELELMTNKDRYKFKT
jgi:hypothetical protein